LNDDDRPLKLSASSEELVVLVIRIVCLGLLGYWSFILIRPFLTIIVWSIIITVALYPIFDWLSAKLHGHRAVAAAAVTVFTFFVMLGPVTWLGLSLAETVRMLVAGFGDGSLAIPPPSEAVQAWPLMGQKIYEVWELASTNLRALVVEVGPYLKPLGTSLLNAAGSVGINLFKFTVSLVISGFLFIPGPSLIHSTKNLLPCCSRAGRRICRFGGSNNSQRLTRHYRYRDLAGAIGRHRLSVRRSSSSRFVQLLGSAVRNNSNRPVGHLSSADRMELVCDGRDDGDSVYALHGAGKFARQHIATTRGKRPENTDADHIDRGARRHARTRHDWSVCRTDCPFDCLAVAYGLDTRRAVTAPG
jgi:hypothetical protein